MESPETWIRLFDAPAGRARPRLQVVLIGRDLCDVDAADVVAGVVFEFYMESGCWLCTYLAVSPAHRGLGLSSLLVGAMRSWISTATGGSDWMLFAETERPERLGVSDRPVALRRLAILSRLGFSRLPFDYVQPALSVDHLELDLLSLLIFGGAGSVVSVARVIGFLREFYDVLGQAGSPFLERMETRLYGTAALLSVSLQSG